VALILDVVGLAQLAHVVSDLGKASGETNAKTASNEGSQNTWLLFTAGFDRRMAIPLSLVSRLEEFPAHMVERAAGHEVIQYRGQIMPLVRVSSALGSHPSSSADPLQVIVYSENGKSVGLIVDEIVDIAEQEVVSECEQSSGLLMGTAVIQQRVTDLFNVQALSTSAAFVKEGALV
jgi:two-component system chemotaxis sensor kinase CheA